MLTIRNIVKYNNNEPRAIWIELEYWFPYLSMPHQQDCKWISGEANITLRAELAIACAYSSLSPTTGQSPALASSFTSITHSLLFCYETHNCAN
jgi:hypothetical protein